ncbi:hypothetical protein B0H13DRAFT_1868602 [Mycena leptocephala]|nr:hypothetical protein B0H13DRAFT_1868602 [Mycena leptocephala]
MLKMVQHIPAVVFLSSIQHRFRVRDEIHAGNVSIPAWALAMASATPTLPRHRNAQDNYNRNANTTTQLLEYEQQQPSTDWPDATALTPRQESAHAALSANPFLISSSDVITSIPSKAANDSDARSFNAFRRQYLRNELRTAKELRTVNEQMVHVETGGSSGLNTGSALPQPDVVSRLAERNEILTARIHELESQLESSWALGFSDDLPPGYTEGET